MKSEDKQLLGVVVKPIEEAACAAQDALNRTLRERVAQEKNVATDSGQPQPRPEEKWPPRERRDSRGRKLPRGVFEPKPAEYWIRFADSTGKIRREKIGPLVGSARDAYHKRRSEAKEGKIFPESMRGRTPVLFQEIVRDFLVYSKRKKRDHKHDITRSEGLLRLWRDCPLADLTPGRIESDLGQSAEEEEWMPATYNRYRALLSGAFSLAMRNGKATANPVSETEKREENNERVRFWSNDEQAQVMAGAQTAAPKLEAQILVALHSGMRRSEQYVTRDCPDGGLKWSYIDFQNRLITIPRSKHGKTRHIRMNSLLLETLRALKRSADSPYVFPGEPPDKLFTEVCQRAGVDDFTWHCLRHTFASRLVMAGVDIRTVRELMGHKTIQMTMRYAHLAPEHEADAVERLVPGNPTAAKTDISTSTMKNITLPSRAVKIKQVS